MGHEDALWLGGALEAPLGQTPVAVTRHELLAVLVPTHRTQRLQVKNGIDTIIRIKI